jgi:hypothetical protein
MDDFVSNKPIPVDNGADKPIPFDDSDSGKASVSRQPLNLGGSGTTQKPKVATPKPTVNKATNEAASSKRITGVKTFFTKLHPGAIEFLDEQISNWLTKNPGISIKLTNTTTGEVQAKKTEPNIIITVWY